MLQDTVAIYNHVSKTYKEEIILLGHSLGTGILINLVHHLNLQNKIILDAPFDNLTNVIKSHFLTNYIWYPFIDYFKIGEDLDFTPDKQLINRSNKILIFHSITDKIIPFKLSLNLINENVKFIVLYQCHVTNYKSKRFTCLIDSFIQASTVQ